MKITAFKYVQRFGEDSFQVFLQTQIQNMKLYLMLDACSLDASLNLCENDEAMELFSSQKKNILENVTGLKLSYIFSSLKSLVMNDGPSRSQHFMTNLHVIKLIDQTVFRIHFLVW